jgi:hypothetical protein
MRRPLPLFLLCLLSAGSCRDPDAPDGPPATGCTDHAGCAAPDRPACVAGRCQPCTRNYHCSGSACDDDGTCHDRGRVLVVDDDPGVCRRAGAPGPGPYCYLREALADPEAGRTRDVILVRPSRRGGHFLDGDYLRIRQGVRLVGARAKRTDPPVTVREPIWISPSPDRDIAVGIEDLRIADLESGQAPGILCLRSPDRNERRVALTVRWSQVVGAPGAGLATEHCAPVRLLSNLIRDNGRADGPGVSISDPELLTMVNNIIVGNGSERSLKGGLALAHQLLPSLIAFNTIADNRCAGIDEFYGCNLHCHHHDRYDVQPIYFTIALRTQPMRESVAGGCLMIGSAVPGDYAGPGMSNLPGLSPRFVRPEEGDYHLAPQAPENRPLRLAVQDPPVRYDHDEDPRPGPGGTDIGADQSLP